MLTELALADTTAASAPDGQLMERSAGSTHSRQCSVGCRFWNMDTGVAAQATQMVLWQPRHKCRLR
jgi:hypothetical protein